MAEFTRKEVVSKLRKKESLAGADLSGLDLSSLKSFAFADLSGANLEGANLQHSNLQGANLKTANLHKVDLSWTNLIDADMSETDLSYSSIYRANLTNANLSNSLAIWAEFTSSTLDNANLLNTNLYGAYLRDIDLRTANLTGADLRGTLEYPRDFFGGPGKGSRIERAKLTEILTETQLIGLDLSDPVTEAEEAGVPLDKILPLLSEEEDQVVGDRKNNHLKDEGTEILSRKRSPQREPIELPKDTSKDWIWGALCFLLLPIIGFLTYLLVNKPFIAMGVVTLGVILFGALLHKSLGDYIGGIGKVLGLVIGIAFLVGFFWFFAQGQGEEGDFCPRCMPAPGYYTERGLY